jgi:hypothetical protein
MARCDTSPCHHNHVGRFDTPEEGAQAYLQHWEKEHPEELKKERAPPLQVQEHLLIRSDKCSTGYKGVTPDKGRYTAQCDTPPCRNNHLGCFGTPEEAAQLYLQHKQQAHSHHPATDTWFQCDDCNKRRRFAAAAAHNLPDPGEEEHWCCKDSGGLYTCAQEEEEVVVVVKQGGGKKSKHQSIETQSAASTSLAGSEKLKNEHPEGREKERAPPLQVQADDKKRKLQSMAEMEHLSGQLDDDNQALKRCKEEFIEEDHVAMQQMMSAVEAVARCSICCDTMKQASTVSGCGHTFCRSCIEEAVRVKGCCPECLLPAWHRDIMDSRRVHGIIEVAADVKL